MYHGRFYERTTGEWCSVESPVGPLSGRPHSLTVALKEWWPPFQFPIRTVNSDWFLDVPPGLLLCASCEVSKQLTTEGEMLWFYKYVFHEVAGLGHNEQYVPWPSGTGKVAFKREPVDKFPWFGFSGFFGTAPEALPVTRSPL
jgi:hypothetical protein